MTRVNSLIIGPGAIGSLVCAHIQRYSSVFVYPHKEPMVLAKQLQTGEQITPLNWTLLTSKSANIDIIWVCCKAPLAFNIVNKLLPSFPTATVALLHNGMGPQEELTNLYPGRIICGSTTCGALKVNSTTYKQTSFGLTNIGLWGTTNRGKLISQHIDQITQWDGLLNFKKTTNIINMLWQKILINAAINPITAAHQIRNGELLEKTFEADIQGICTEISVIMTKLGLPPLENAVEIVRHVATISAQNRSSMAEDVRLGQKTEIDYINGYLIKTAEQLGISTPFLVKWYKQIAQLELS